MLFTDTVTDERTDPIEDADMPLMVMAAHLAHRALTHLDTLAGGPPEPGGPPARGVGGLPPAAPTGVR